MVNYLEKLNSAQQKAVLQTEGPVLILAGAGAGKTRVITYRIAHLIKQGVSPEQILAVTFTNKAAKEMRERVDHLLKNEFEFSRPVAFQTRPFIKTFHSLGVHIIKENSEILNLPRRFTIFDSADSKKAIKDSLVEAGYDPKEHEPRKIQAIISNQKNNLMTPEDYAEQKSHYSYLADVVSKTWSIYNRKLKEEKALDFDDLLIKTTEIFQTRPEILKKYQTLWKYIHIDEYQDTNEVQYLMSKLLAQSHQNICVVGDVDQNIYSWRGATINNILNFEKDYNNTSEIVLEENYRSTQNILKAANDVIAKNQMRKEKNLFTKNGEGEKIMVYQAIDEYDEANFAVQKAKELIRQGTDPNNIAFLYRTNFQSRVLEEVCLKENLAHQVIGTKFFDRKEVKDILAYIKASLNSDDTTNLSRIINVPKRGIGKETLIKILAKQEGLLSKMALEKINGFKNLLKNIENEIKIKKPHEVINFILQKSGLEEVYKKDGEEGLERLANVKELISLAKKYEDYENPAEAMEQFLEDVSLSSDQDEMEDKSHGVKLMTVHAAKGLEFDYVFVTGLEAGLFPKEVFNEEGKDEEEERRLFYVAITRAKKQLFLSYACFRTIFGSKEINTQSEFIDDIDKNILEYNSSDNSDDTTVEYLIDF